MKKMSDQELKQKLGDIASPVGWSQRMVRPRRRRRIGQGVEGPPADRWVLPMTYGIFRGGWAGLFG